MTRYSRHCYDKYWRCPGWAGGGWHFAKNSTCPSGSLVIDYDLPKWRQNLQFHHCADCDMIAIPNIIKWLDPTWLWFVTNRKIRNWWWDNFVD